MQLPPHSHLQLWDLGLAYSQPRDRGLGWSGNMHAPAFMCDGDERGAGPGHPLLCCAEQNAYRLCCFNGWYCLPGNFAGKLADTWLLYTCS